MRTFQRRMKTIRWTETREKIHLQKYIQTIVENNDIFEQAKKEKLKLESISVNKQFTEGFEEQSTCQITSGDRKRVLFSQIHMKFL